MPPNVGPDKLLAHVQEWLAADAARAVQANVGAAARLYLVEQRLQRLSHEDRAGAGAARQRHRRDRVENRSVAALCDADIFWPVAITDVVDGGHYVRPEVEIAATAADAPAGVGRVTSHAQ